MYYQKKVINVCMKVNILKHYVFCGELTRYLYTFFYKTIIINLKI